ncbi:hypothetical protein KCP77_13700 [Salmonella enterica subsp. enterica]|nr:hypothetical protein KCP77_13700 [Salmonella enterica subsp. enterica]
MKKPNEVIESNGENENAMQRLPPRRKKSIRQHRCATASLATLPSAGYGKVQNRSKKPRRGKQTDEKLTDLAVSK